MRHATLESCKGGAVTEATEATDIRCPRCHQPAAARFYGPCDACRTELRATMGGEGRHVEVAAFEPRANVVPNHVATRE